MTINAASFIVATISAPYSNGFLKFPKNHLQAALALGMLYLHSISHDKSYKQAQSVEECFLGTH
ncbi:hypothetical protein [Burkholderia ubonensis]|uniref:hypothetical protein n=1 Tax=Burkholderia ubonensis TaxID=101571 RepID=UPI0011601993|nr:hypothetical protein [Burkholderia ubonensis]